MDYQTAFYAAGIALVLLALATFGIGSRRSEFPSPGVFRAGVVLFLALVATTATFAFLNAHEEQKVRREKLAAEKETQRPKQARVAPQNGGPGEGAQGAEIAFDVAPGTTLAYTQKQVSTKAGADTLVLNNPQVIEHDVTIAQGATVVGKTALTTKNRATAQITLKPGSYDFYCSVPGHREAGMQGKLTVK
ncbi:MAG: hypothetical protein QOG09_920 [Solirubrobacterales bacterium]|jgi:uncharacterized cupredoxin-like copper-binding protein|nr:hypothetical protein [Solirubrobacterales bacterium]